jgi:hypothetical protein
MIAGISSFQQPQASQPNISQDTSSLVAVARKTAVSFQNDVSSINALTNKVMQSNEKYYNNRGGIVPINNNINTVV